jgi:hypothetical protein
MKRTGLKPWKMAVVLLMAGVLGFGYGFLSNETRLPPYLTVRRVLEWSRDQITLVRLYYFLRGTPIRTDGQIRGSWQSLDGDAGRDHSGNGSDDARRNFQAVGYLSGYEPASDLKGVTAHIEGEAYQGLNLITSGHGQEALLIDMEGRVLHKWAYDFSRAFPDYADVEGRIEVGVFFKDFWRRSYLYPNGDLLAIYDGFGMIKLDRDSRLIWAVRYGCHHDMCVDKDGFIYVITREPRMMPRLNRDLKVLEDFIAVLDPEGRMVRKVSVVEALEQSAYASFLRSIPDISDILHTNTVEVFDGSHAHRSSLFRKGNVLISIRNINIIGILDMEAEEVVWALSGQWLAQHDPTLLTDGNMLLFDNQGHHGMSKVIEFDPFTQEIEWAYEGTPENGFYTETSGTAHRLPNGNTLIVESNSGRAFEVTRQDRIVWEYYSPFRAGENDRLIATLFDVVRLDQAYVAGWLDEGGAGAGPTEGEEPKQETE